MKINNLIIIVLISLSLLMGGLEVILNSRGEFITEKTQTIWGIVFILLSIMWVSNDAKQKKFAKPFDFGFLMYILWPISFPYYLIATRGIDGIIYASGFLAIWAGPWLAGLIAYVYIY